MRSLLISRDDIVTITHIDGLVDSDKYTQNVLYIQDSELTELIGEDLLAKIEDGIANANLTEPYFTLLKDYIKYFLAHATAADFVLLGNYRIANGGLTKYNTTSESSVGLSEVEKIADAILVKSNFYGQRLIKYLKNNKSLFPEYVLPESDSMFWGWELDDDNC